jgi:hypothetical protein
VIGLRRFRCCDAVALAGAAVDGPAGGVVGNAKSGRPRPRAEADHMISRRWGSAIALDGCKVDGALGIARAAGRELGLGWGG